MAHSQDRDTQPLSIQSVIAALKGAGFNYKKAYEQGRVGVHANQPWRTSHVEVTVQGGGHDQHQNAKDMAELALALALFSTPKFECALGMHDGYLGHRTFTLYCWPVGGERPSLAPERQPTPEEVMAQLLPWIGERRAIKAEAKNGNLQRRIARLEAELAHVKGQLVSADPAPTAEDVPRGWADHCETSPADLFVKLTHAPETPRLGDAETNTDRENGAAVDAGAEMAGTNAVGGAE